MTHAPTRNENDVKKNKVKRTQHAEPTGKLITDFFKKYGIPLLFVRVVKSYLGINKKK